VVEGYLDEFQLFWSLNNPFGSLENMVD
jgi:hypothetical protein